MNKDISKFCLSMTDSLKKALETVDANQLGIVLVVDSKGVLVGTVTDGDIRRHLLKTQNFDAPLKDLYCRQPIIAKEGTKDSDLLREMNSHKIRQIPIVSKDGKPVRIAEITRLTQDGEKPWAVIMAGGKGSRLYPLTKDVPKPMLKVGDIPVLENTVRRLAESNIKDIVISVHHQAQAITDYFQDGSKFGVSIHYLHENTPLGNAGALRLLPEIPRRPFIVLNGDVLTKVNFLRLLDYHDQHKAVMTIAAVEYVLAVPYGVLNLAGHYLLGVDEKPKQRVLCNAGMYVLNPDLLRFIPEEKPFDMTQLLQTVLDQGLPVTACPIHEYWLDIGQKQDYEKANKDFEVNFKS